MASYKTDIRTLDDASELVSNLGGLINGAPAGSDQALLDQASKNLSFAHNLIEGGELEDGFDQAVKALKNLYAAKGRQIKEMPQLASRRVAASTTPVASPPPVQRPLPPSVQPRPAPVNAGPRPQQQQPMRVAPRNPAPNQTTVIVQQPPYGQPAYTHYCPNCSTWGYANGSCGCGNFFNDFLLFDMLDGGNVGEAMFDASLMGGMGRGGMGMGGGFVEGMLIGDMLADNNGYGNNGGYGGSGGGGNNDNNTSDSNNTTTTDNSDNTTVVNNYYGDDSNAQSNEATDQGDDQGQSYDDQTDQSNAQDNSSYDQPDYSGGSDQSDDSGSSYSDDSSSYDSGSYDSGNDDSGGGW